MFSKLSIIFFLVLTFLVALIVFFSYSTIRTHYLDKSKNDLLKYNRLIQDKLNFISNIDSDNQELILNLDSLASFLKIRITLIRENGDVIYDSDEDYNKMENHLSRPEVKEALTKSVGYNLRKSNTVNEEMFYVAKLYKNQENVFFIRNSFFVKEMNLLLKNVRNEMLEIAILVYLLSLIILLIFSKKLTKPLKTLSFISQKVASGDFSLKTNLKVNDEIGELAKNFNDMTSQLNKLFKKVNIQKEELNSIISNIQEAILLINNKGKIILVNDTLLKWLNQGNILGQNIRDVINEKKLIKFVEKSLKQKRDRSKEFEIDGKYYLCSVSYMKIKDEMIVLLHDYTELKKLELIKKDLSINLSHELRTPLTAIKGFSETLQDYLTNDEAKRYTKIISKHADRLIVIVNELLELSELEETNTQLHYQNINILKLFNDVKELFIEKLKSNNLEFSINVEDEQLNVNADIFRIEQALINLIDNAIKYTDKGMINLSAFKEDNVTIIELEDTGKGIPDDELDRIFERFYIVEKSRARKVGASTGLGLAIVKHIINLHNGDINVESKLNVGTKFIIRLPDNN